MTVTRFSTGAIRDNALATNTSFAASDMELIGTVRVGSGGVASVTFSNIPQEYKHLQVRGIARENGGGGVSNDFGVRVNGDTSTSNYVLYHVLYGGGATAGSAAYLTGFSFMKLANVTGSASAANLFGGFVIDLLDYTSPFKYKVFRSIYGQDQNNTNGQVGIESGMWMSNSPVTSLLFNNSNGSGTGLAFGTRISLYGIRG